LLNSCAERYFGFRAKTPLREGLEATVAWYIERAAKEAAGVE
jgi:nucleoside-diphosphate-sugar epimerase